MLLQEVGFDIVSMWNQMGWLTKGVLLLMPVVGLLLVVVVIRSVLTGSRRNTTRP